MQFTHSFQRRKGSGSASIPTIGSDVAPSGQPTAAQSNQASLQSASSSGFPVRRLAIGITGPAATIGCSFWVYDTRTASWFLMNGTPTNITVGLITPVTVPALIDRYGARTGALDIAIIANDDVGIANGIYTIGVGPDVGS